MNPTRLSPLLSLVLLSFLLSGCETAYQERGAAGGGYQDEQVSPNTFRVSFRGGTHTSAGRVADLAQLRAAEVALAHGFKYFTVVDRADAVHPVSYALPGAARDDTGPGGMSGTCGSSDNLYDADEEAHSFEPETELRIRCFAATTHARSELDAAAVATSIRQKYGLSTRGP